MEIYLRDLKEETQKEVLKEMGLKNSSEGNLEIAPLFILDCEESEEEQEDYPNCDHCGKADCPSCGSI